MSLTTIDASLKRTPRTFRDMLVRDYGVGCGMDVENWITSKMVSVDFLDEVRTVPKVTFSKEALEMLNRPWKKALVVKLLGTSVGYQMLSRRVQMLEKPKGELDILGLSLNYFLMKFDL